MANFFVGYLAQGTGSTSFVENTTPGYAREGVSLATLHQGTTQLSGGVTFSGAAGAYVVTQRGLYDAPTGGNLLQWWRIVPRSVGAGGSDTLRSGELTHFYPDLASASNAYASTIWAAGAVCGFTSIGNPIYAGVACCYSAGGIEASSAVGIGSGGGGTSNYSISSLGTISVGATLTPSNITVGGVYGGQDVQIPLRNLSTALASVYAGALTLTQPTAMQVFQRDTRSGAGFGHGAGLVSFTIGFSQPATLLEYQLVNASGGAVLQAWTQAAVAISSGAQTISFSIPASLNWYLVQFRANSDPTSIVATTNKIAVGEVVAFSGQSLVVDFVTQYITGDPTTLASLGLTVNPFGPVFAAFTNSDGVDNNSPASPVNYPGTWALPADSSVYSGSFAVQFLNQAISKLNVPVALVGYAVGGTTLAQWQPGYTQPTGGPNNNYGNLIAVLGASGGKFGTMLWMQGHNDAKAGAGTTASGILSALQTFFISLCTIFPNSFKLVLSSIPAFPGYGAATFGSVAAVRQGYQQYAASQSAPYVDGHDAALFLQSGSPSVHPSQAGNVTLANHFYRAFMQAIGGLSHGDAGPLITGISRAYGSSQIGVTLSEVNGGTTLSQIGTISTLFQVFPSGTTTSLYTVGSVTIVNAGSLSIGISPTPTEPAALDLWYLAPFDTTISNVSGIYDNATDGDGLTQGRLMSMIPNAITALSPQVFLTVGAIANLSTSAPPRSLAPMGTAHRPAWNTALTAGRALLR